jgi:hypothetical protein
MIQNVALAGKILYTSILIVLLQKALVAQLDRVSDSESEGRWFKSNRARQDLGLKKIHHFHRLFWFLFG